MFVFLSCYIFDFFLILLVDAYLVEVFIPSFSVDSFGAIMKFSCPDVHPGILAFLRMSIKFSYCLYVMSSFLSR
jgi:hypothetical protein